MTTSIHTTQLQLTTALADSNITAAKITRSSLADQVLLDLLEWDREETAFWKWADRWHYRGFSEKELREIWRTK